MTDINIKRATRRLNQLSHSVPEPGSDPNKTLTASDVVNGIEYAKAQALLGIEKQLRIANLIAISNSPARNKFTKYLDDELKLSELASDSHIRQSDLPVYDDRLIKALNSR